MTNHELRKLAEAAKPGELKPCPFCGGSDLDESANGIFCGECHAQVLGAGATSDRDTWNRRAELDSLRASLSVSEVERAYKTGYLNGASCYIGAPDSEEDMAVAQQQSWDMHRAEFATLLDELDSLRAPVAVSEVEAAARRFQDAFTNGNASWEETPQHHKDAFMAGARAALGGDNAER